MSCSCVAFSYVEKFTEFLRLFVSIHLRRFENNNMFPILEFLSLLFKYTFKQVIMCFRIVFLWRHNYCVSKFRAVSTNNSRACSWGCKYDISEWYRREAIKLICLCSQLMKATSIVWISGTSSWITSARRWRHAPVSTAIRCCPSTYRLLDCSLHCYEKHVWICMNTRHHWSVQLHDAIVLSCSCNDALVWLIDSIFHDVTVLSCRYNDALVSLINSILQKFQFKHNQSQLDELDDDTLDDDVSDVHLLTLSLGIVSRDL